MCKKCEDRRELVERCVADGLLLPLVPPHVCDDTIKTINSVDSLHILPLPSELPSPYHRVRKLTKKESEQGFIVMDFNDLVDLVGNLSSRRVHSAKKVLFGGGRGHKDVIKDLKEAMWTLQNEVDSIQAREDG